MHPERRAVLLLGVFCCLARTQAQDPVCVPLEFGTRIAIFRGNDTPPTHLDEWNKYAFDFVLPVGSPVYAAASGTVVVVKEDSAGPTGQWRDNNQIAILHEDGFAALYEHLKKDGVAVVVGQQVLAGDLIGWSGNTGNSAGPHLHFVMRGWRDMLQPAVPTRFLEVQNGGVPKTNEMVVSRNFPIREIVGELADLIELYGVCADADAREALAPELGRVSREKMPETVRRRIAAVKDRSDLRAIHERWRKKLLDRVEAELTGARDRLTTLRAGGTPEAIHRFATLAHRDFAFCDQVREFEASAKEQKKALGPSLDDPKLEALLRYRSAVTSAVRAEIKWLGTRKGLDQTAPRSVKALFEAAIKVAPSEETRTALERHLESPPFGAESRPSR
jgi:hypothetical protein